MSKINLILNNSVNEYIQELLHLKIKPINIDIYENYRKVDEILAKDIIIAAQRYNDEATELNKMIDSEINEHFEVIDITLTKINLLIEKLNEKTESLNKVIMDIKIVNNDIDKTKIELLSINDKIAYFEIGEIYTNYCNDIQDVEKKRLDLDLKKKQIDENIKKIEQYNKEKGDINIAIKELNKYLSYVK